MTWFRSGVICSIGFIASNCSIVKITVPAPRLEFYRYSHIRTILWANPVMPLSMGEPRYRQEFRVRHRGRSSCKLKLGINLEGGIGHQARNFVFVCGFHWK